jgi:hypothetical protein
MDITMSQAWSAENMSWAKELEKMSVRRVGFDPAILVLAAVLILPYGLKDGRVVDRHTSNAG